MTSLDWTPDAIDSLVGRRILVVGDLILDRYVWGRCERTSPEAPALVLEYESEHVILGGAGNVVHNLCAAGARPIACGVVGRDDNGRQTREMLRALGVPVGGVIADPSRPTSEKTRAMAGGQQILRIDRERRHTVGGATLKRIETFIEKNIAKCEGVIISDYAKGVLAPALIARIVALAKKRGVVVVADPKGADYSRYKGVDFITPNQKEAQAASGVTIEDADSLEAATRQLMRLIGGQGVVVTRGHEGTYLSMRRGRTFLAPQQPREVYDVSGAGDTFISYFALALAAGHEPEQAVALGNLVGGLSVEKIGVATISLDEARREIDGLGPTRKLKSLQDLEAICAQMRGQGRRIVMAHGCFDQLRPEDIRLLSEARRGGDALVVSVLSDKAARRRLGDGRPTLKLAERLDALTAISPIDYLVVCDEASSETIEAALKPAVLAPLKRTKRR